MKTLVPQAFNLCTRTDKMTVPPKIFWNIKQRDLNKVFPWLKAKS
jgi:hypothetical protein